MLDNNINSRLFLDRVKAVAAAVLLALLIIISPCQSKAQSVPCLTFFGPGLPDGTADDIGTGTCVVAWPNLSGSAPLRGWQRIIYPTGWMDENPSRRNEEIEATIDAIYDSVHMLEALGLLAGKDDFNMTVLLGALYLNPTLAERIRRAAVPTAWLGIDKNSICPVLVGDWQGAEGAPIEDLKFVLAHELTHCFLHWQLVPSIDNWWVEGVATYFAHLVYPDNDLEHTKAVLFKPRVEMFAPEQNNYSTVAFFLWLELQGQNDLIFRTLLNAGPINQVSQYHEMLSRWDDIADIFHEFGKQFYSDGFTESSGSQVPLVQPEPGEREIDVVVDDASGALELVAYPFQIFAEKFELEPGRSYDIAVEENDVPGQYQIKIDEGDWVDMPTNIVTDCDGATEITVLATSTAPPAVFSDDVYTLSVDFKWEPSGLCGCGFSLVSAAMIAETPSTCAAAGPPLDRCLIGVWSLAPESYRAELERNLERAGAGTILAAEASARISVSEDGVADSCMVASSHIEIESRGKRIEAITEINSAETQVLNSMADGALCSTVVQSDSVAIATAKLDGETISKKTIVLPPPVFSLRSEYFCDADSLTIRAFPPGVDYVEHHFIRED